MKKYLINGKIYGLLGIIDLNKLNNWNEGVEGQSIWLNIALEKKSKINRRKHTSFLFITTSLNDLLSFSINLIDKNNNEIIK